MTPEQTVLRATVMLRGGLRGGDKVRVLPIEDVDKEWIEAVDKILTRSESDTWELLYNRHNKCVLGLIGEVVSWPSNDADTAFPYAVKFDHKEHDIIFFAIDELEIVELV